MLRLAAPATLFILYEQSCQTSWTWINLLLFYRRASLPGSLWNSLTTSFNVSINQTLPAWLVRPDTFSVWRTESYGANYTAPTLSCDYSRTPTHRCYVSWFGSNRMRGSELCNSLHKTLSAFTRHASVLIPDAFTFICRHVDVH